MKTKQVEIKEPVSADRIQGNKTMELFQLASLNKTPLLNRSYRTLSFETIRKDGKEIRELAFENENVRIVTNCPATKDALKDALECYKGMCLYVLGAIDEIG